jgi:arylsulfatase A-like enzyme
MNTCSRMTRKRSWRAGGMCLGFLWLALSGCSRRTEPAARPNIVLVTIDTLRADRLSAYGYDRETTPFLDSLAAAGVRFATTYSPSSWTVPSMASLFTSLEPDYHGIQRGLVEDDRIVGQQVLADSFTLLAEVLRAAGYRTFGVSANLHLASEYGFGQGFDRYENLGFANADRIAPVLEAWGPELEAGAEPYFLWIHYFDPHDPYYPREPWFENPVPALAGEVSANEPIEIWHLYWLNSPDGRRRNPRRLKPELRIAQAAYDSEISYTDDQIRRAFDHLGIGPETLVVVTSDHGEAFYEHEHLGHGQDLHEEQVRVPLIIRLPGGASAGRVIDQPVSLIDVMPTIFDVLGIAAPPAIQGDSLLRLMAGEQIEPPPIFLSIARDPPGIRGIRQGHWKYLHDLADPKADRLFDLQTDPGEQRNRVSAEPGITRELANELDRFLAAVPESLEPELEEVDEKTLDQLRALGYVD